MIPLVVDQPFLLPLVPFVVPAGFPSPALDFDCKAIDLHALLIGNAPATFLWRLSGWSMRDLGLGDGDLLMVDRSLKPLHGDIVVAEVDGDFTCKQLYQRGQEVKLLPANSEFPEIVFRDGQSLTISGVVTAAIKRFRHVRPR